MAGQTCYLCQEARCNCTSITWKNYQQPRVWGQDLSDLSGLTQSCTHSFQFVLQRLTQHISCLWQCMPLPVDLLPQCAELFPIHLHMKSKVHMQLGASVYCTTHMKTASSCSCLYSEEVMISCWHDVYGVLLQVHSTCRPQPARLTLQVTQQQHSHGSTRI